jgi:hypothetical protein
MPIETPDLTVQTDLPLGAPAYARLLESYAGLDPALIRLSPNDTALITGLAPKTLEGMRVEGRGPAFMKLGRRVQYRLADVIAFMAANTFTTTREAKTARAGGVA